MKKSFITALTLCAAALAYGDDATVSTTGSSTDQASFRGWYGSLSDDCLIYSIDLTELVKLTQITITTPSFDIGMSNTVKLAIYTATVTDSGISIGDYVGLSDNYNTYANSTTLDFNFSDVTLSTDTLYAFLFVSADTTEEELTAEGASVDTYSTLFRTSLYKYTGDSTTGWLLSSSTLTASGDYVPIVSYSVSTIVVPEPATATLSLLALAGLAARRRRK